MNLEAKDGVEMIMTAYQEKNREEAYQFYLQTVANMDEETFISFEEFYKVDNDTSNHTYAQKDKEEIYNDVENILEKFNFEKGSSE